MRTKEYINLHQQELKHADIVSQIIKDLLPLRSNRAATSKYASTLLFADIRYQQYLLQKELYERGNAMQIEEPRYEAIAEEVPMDIALDVRDELFHVIEQDGSFGYLYYILGTEQNARHNNDPIDCIPNDERIIQCLINNRDDYPKDNLDGFINEKLNYQQYNILIDGDYWEDDDAFFLKYFNRVYEMYDELRLRKQSISSIKGYLKEQTFESDAEKYWIFSFIITLIEETEFEDESLNRCKQELTRIINPLKEQFDTQKRGEYESPVYLAERRGSKIDIIRVLNVLYELATFTGEGGKPISKKEFMTTMGKAINVDLTNYDKDLSRALSDSTALDKHLKIFKEMLQKMTDIFNLH